jgi:dihydroorotase
LSSEQYKKSGSLALTDPPLRTPKDVLALWSALKSGSIDIIASDHAPHALNEKKFNDIWKVKPGIPGLEITLSLLLTQVNKGRLSLRDLVKLTAEKPAKTFQLNERGSLSEGNWADLVVVDMKREYDIDSSHFFSKAKYSPFDGMHVKGKPVKTFVNGNLVMDDNQIVAKPGTGLVVPNMLKH